MFIKGIRKKRVDTEMRFYLIKEMLLLANRQKTTKEKIKYLFQGIIFLPFLKRDLMRTKNNENESTSLSAAGDDVYPLF